MDNDKQNSALKYITPAVAVALIAGAAIWMNNKPAAAPTEQTPATPNSTTGEQTNNPSSTPATGTAKYKAGSYTAIGDYQSPGGHDQLGLTVTLDANGTITDAKAEEKPSNPASQKWQEKFIAGFNAEVVGKPIDQVSLSIVNGSSLTPKGFMDALEKIKVQASAS